MTSTHAHSVIPVKTGIQKMCYIEIPTYVYNTVDFA